MRWWVKRYLKLRDQSKKEKFGDDYYCDGEMEDKESKLSRLSFWGALRNLLIKRKNAERGDSEGYKPFVNDEDYF
jgi:hypothetical protein